MCFVFSNYSLFVNIFLIKDGLKSEITLNLCKAVKGQILGSFAFIISDRIDAIYFNYKSLT